MEIWIYSPYEHVRVGILDSYDSMTRTHRDDAPDEIEITLRAAGGDAIAQVDSILWPSGDTTAYLVTSVDIEDEETGATHERIRGKSMETLLAMRYLSVPKSFTGTPGQICAQMCDEVFSDGARAFPGLTYDFGAATGETMTLSAEGTLLDNVCAALTAGLYGIRSAFSPATCAVHIFAHAGQTRNIAFDERYDTLSEARYTDDISDASDMCYVYDDEGECLTVGNVALTGYRRREGSDWHTSGRESYDDEGNEIELTDAQYRRAMQNTGAGYMSAHRRSQEMSGTVNLQSKLVKYGDDFDLGDVCTIRKAAWGVNLKKRLTTVIETYENGVATMHAEFGTATPTLSEKIKRGETA
ncbi:Gp37-like protein [Beduinella massiliensis]|uniref:Gp37-like protein n=1 Tax=Beduinella massiliensis TaxID=1852363 RepID=UPI0031FA3548